MVKTYDRGDGLLVDYSDYAAIEADFGKAMAFAKKLEAERDEWKRRCEKMVAKAVDMGRHNRGREATPEASRIVNGYDVVVAMRAIAEGRDNG